MIELNTVTKVFKTFALSRTPPFCKRESVLAVDQLGFRVEAGEIFGLLGPNGAGKTTTVKMISGLVRPTAGTVFVNGLDVNKKRKEVLQQIGVLLEGTRTCFWPLTVRENLEYFANIKGITTSRVSRHIDEIIDFLGLVDKRDVTVRNLSRGMKQKLSVGIALLSEPSVLLLDEPTTGLDVQMSRAIRNLVRELTKEQNKTVVVTTHDMAVAEDICDRVAIIHKGRLVVLDTTSNLRHLFSEHVYEFRFANAPSLDGIAEMPTVKEISARGEAGGIMVTAMLEGSESDLSETIYELMEVFKREEGVLTSVTRREQRLEDIFVRLTGIEEQENVNDNRTG